MDRAGFEKSRARLAEAFRFFEQLKLTNNCSDFESAWNGFVVNLNSVYSTLEQSVKGYPCSEAWFSREKKKRKADQALQYLWQARNSNEHSIREILVRHPGGIGIGHPSGSMFIKELRVGSEGIEHLEGWGPDGSPLEIKAYPERVELVPVFNRGQWFDPPSHFFDEELKERTPVELASKVLAHMTYLFSDAQDLLVT